jgi:hypothetical protein
MSWFLIIVLAANVQVIPVASRAQCDAIRAELLNAYGKGSALLDVRCFSTVDPKAK